MRARLVIASGMAAIAVAAYAAGPLHRTMAAEQKTLKEQLSDKASDDQRVNNCHVPVERRGPKPRPGCPPSETPSSPPSPPSDRGERPAERDASSY